MSESEISPIESKSKVLDNEHNSALANDKHKKINRRAFLKNFGKKAAIITASGYVSNSIMSNVLQGNLPFESSYNAIFSEAKRDPNLREIEEKLDIRLITLKEAYKKSGVSFNERDRDEFGDVLPTRWGDDRALLISRLFPMLPDFFHEKNGNGERLNIALTNYGDKKRAGEYRELPFRDDVMLLDYDEFSPNDSQIALRLLCHESIHRIQPRSQLKELVEYKTGNSSVYNPKIEKFVGKRLEDICKPAIHVLDSLPETKNIEFENFRNQLRYAVQDMSNEVKPRKNPAEFEARLGEFYLEGFDYFLRNASVFFGTELSENLYQYLRDEIFGGIEYEKFPLNEFGLNENEMDKVIGIGIFNNLISKYVQPQIIENSDISLINTDLDLQVLANQKQTSVFKMPYQKNNQNFELFKIEYSPIPNSPQRIEVNQDRTMDRIVRESIKIYNSQIKLNPIELKNYFFDIPDSKNIEIRGDGDIQDIFITVDGFDYFIRNDRHENIIELSINNVGLG